MLQKIKTYLKVNKLSGGANPVGTSIPGLSGAPSVTNSDQASPETPSKSEDDIKGSNYDELKTYIENNKDKITLWSNVFLHLNSIIGSISKEEFLERISAEIKSQHPEWIYTSSYLLKQLNKGVDKTMLEDNDVYEEKVNDEAEESKSKKILDKDKLKNKYNKILKLYFEDNNDLNQIIQNFEEINIINSEHTDDTIQDVKKTMIIVSGVRVLKEIDVDLYEKYIIKIINEGFGTFQMKV